VHLLHHLGPHGDEAGQKLGGAAQLSAGLAHVLRQAGGRGGVGGVCVWWCVCGEMREGKRGAWRPQVQAAQWHRQAGGESREATQALQAHRFRAQSGGGRRRVQRGGRRGTGRLGSL
jgi:hypothetical protein